MDNINDLREQLLHTFTELQSGALDRKDAAELANLSGKVINSAKVQLEYYSLRKEKPVLRFLESPDMPPQDEEK